MASSGILHFAGFSPIYAGGSSTSVSASVSTSHIAYILVEQTKDLKKWSQLSVHLVHAKNDLLETYSIEPDSYVRIKLYGGVGEIKYTLDFEEAPPAVTIGNITIDAVGIQSGTISAGVNDIIDLSIVTANATATDLTYIWSVQNGSNVTFVGAKNKATAQAMCQGAGAVDLTCTVSSATATDSPKNAVAVIDVTVGIGEVSITGAGITAKHLDATVGDVVDITAAISGGVTDMTYDWWLETVNNNCVAFDGGSARESITETITCSSAGDARIALKVASATAGDSPAEGFLTVVVTPAAKEAKPDLDLSGADDLMKFTIPQLKDFAVMNGIDVGGLPKDKRLLAEYIAANMNLKN